jgi:hypothetical protein
MDIVISVLAVLALFAGVALGTFRHRSYGIWSFAGILLAMTIAHIAGDTLGDYVRSAVNGDIVTVTVLVKITLVVVISLLISYYCDNLIPITPDPKTQTDNIYAGVFGLVNSYLIVGSILGYLKAIPSQDPKVATNIFSNSFNNWLFDVLPWVVMATFFYVIGWASVRKIREAVDMLKSSMQKTPAPSTSSTTGSLSTASTYSAPAAPSWQQPSSSYSSGYQSSSVTASVATPAVAAVPAEPKPSIFGRLFGGFGRKEEAPVAPPPPATPSPTGYGSYGLGNNTGYGSSTSGYQSPTSNLSGATPPYGINTGSISAANPSYGTPAPAAYQSPAQQSFGGYNSSSYTPSSPPPAPSYTASGGFGQPSAPSSGYQPSFGTPTPVSGFTSPNPYGTNANYGQQDEEPDYGDQSSFDEDNDQDDDNDGYGGYNGANQPPPYRG